MTIQLHNLPPSAMQRITDRAKAHHRRERFNRWVRQHIIMDDPRSQDEQMRDDMARDRSPVWFALIVLLCVLCYAVAAAFVVW